MKNKDLQYPMKKKPEQKQIEVSDEQLKAVGIKWWCVNTRGAGYTGYFLWENRTLFMALETARDYAVDKYLSFDKECLK